MKLDQRILNRAEGFWPRSPLTAQARKAWSHLLAQLPADRVLDALDEYAAEGHPHPPMAGQLVARTKPDLDPSTESEADRCRRQIASALGYRRRGNPNVPAEDLRWYWETYWSKHLPESENPLNITPAREAEAA